MIEPPPFINNYPISLEAQLPGPTEESGLDSSKTAQAGKESQSSESESNTGGVQSVESSEPNIEKVPAYNNSSENEMPAEIPQGAIDNSPSLENSPTLINESNPTPTIPTLTPTPREINPRIVIPPPIDESPIDRGCGCGQSGKGNTICVCIN